MIFATPTGRNGSKLGPRRSQDGPKIAQEAPKTAQEAPKTAQEAPRRPKIAPRSPRSRPRRPKIPPRRPQDAPRASPRHRPWLKGGSTGRPGKASWPPKARRGEDYKGGASKRRKFLLRDLTRPWAEGPANLKASAHSTGPGYSIQWVELSLIHI